jgi:hypothetical protein
MRRRVEFTSRIDRRHESLPRYLVVPAEHVAPWRLSRATTVEVTIDGVYLGRRPLRRLDPERWFLELTEAQRQRLDRDVGARVRVAIEVADATVPQELATALARDPAAGKRWQAMTEPQRRMLRDYVAAARTPTTRSERALRALAAAATKGKRVPAAAASAASGARSAGTRFPIRAELVVDDPVPRISIAMQRGRDELLLPASTTRERLVFTFELEAVVDGGIDWRGDIVHGPRDGRFLYVNAGCRAGQHGVAWDRRAKVALPKLTRAAAAAVARTGMTATIAGRAKDGGPCCASVSLIAGWRPLGGNTPTA